MGRGSRARLLAQVAQHRRQLRRPGAGRGPTWCAGAASAAAATSAAAAARARALDAPPEHVSCRWVIKEPACSGERRHIWVPRREGLLQLGGACAALAAAAEGAFVAHEHAEPCQGLERRVRGRARRLLPPRARLLLRGRAGDARARRRPGALSRRVPLVKVAGEHRPTGEELRGRCAVSGR